MSEQVFEKRPTVYESAIDTWIAVMLFFAPAIAVPMGVYLIWIGRPADGSVMFVVAALSLLATAAFTVPCRYTLLKDTLSIRCGLICYQVPYDEIMRVEKTASLRSGPALSMRRVLVETEKKKHILSPKDRDAFIDDLSRAAKHVLIAAPSAADGS
jgi:membrane protein YdbS with pleckstrin-like domain